MYNTIINAVHRDGVSTLPVTTKREVTRPPFRVTNTILPSIPVDWRDLTRTWGRKWHTDLPQSVAKLTTASATKNWKQPESRIQNIIKMNGATTGHRNSYRYDFEATSEVSVTDCDGHIYIHIYKRSATQASRLLVSPSGSAMITLLYDNYFAYLCVECCAMVCCVLDVKQWIPFNNVLRDLI